MVNLRFALDLKLKNYCWTVFVELNLPGGRDKALLGLGVVPFRWVHSSPFRDGFQHLSMMAHGTGGFSLLSGEVVRTPGVRLISLPIGEFAPSS